MTKVANYGYEAIFPGPCRGDYPRRLFLHPQHDPEKKKRIQDYKKNDFGF